MIEKNDHRTQRCRKLGHPITFDYCRREASGTLCSSILNCWWEIFDVRAFLEENAPEALEEMLARKPQPKVATIVDLIQRAKQARQDSAG